jgi:peroxiredoxin
MSDEGFSFSGYERDPLFMNMGGKKVLDISGVSGIDSITDGRAGVFADFDNDGDVDILMTTIQGPGHLFFRNNVGSAGGFVRVTLSREKALATAGAEVRISSAGVLQTRVHSCGEGFLSQHDPRLLFGLAGAKAADWIEVRWPNGKTERHAGPFASGSSWLIAEGAKAPVAITEQRSRLADPDSPDNAVLRTLGLRVGGALPTLKLVDDKGAAAALPVKQRTLIQLWASWCTTCAREMPELESLHTALSKAGIQVLGLAVDEPEAGLGHIASTRKLTFPLLRILDAGPSLYPAGEVIVPFTLLLGEDGRIQRAWRGWNAEVQADIQALLR